MAVILKLPRHLADLIAAGEVVERPASVVKELTENSFDSGATAVTVEIQNGGMTFIRVTDNGCGIRREDTATAFLRHATSKLRDAGGLAAIETLGFRGEALAAISAVSRIETVTRTEDEDEGTRIVLEGSEQIEIEPAARPPGTTITVRDLFFNTPARQKFMKSDRAEASAVSQAVIRLALSRPDISVRYIRDGAEELYTPGDSKLESCVYAALGREFSSGLKYAESDVDGVTVRGYVSTVEALRGNRNYQFFLVNGRNVKSKTLQAALEQAYRNRMLTGRYPSCVLYITLGYSRLDVNVHPAKTEVRFLSDKQAFDGVYHAALSALESAVEPLAEAQKTPADYTARTEPDYKEEKAEIHTKTNAAAVYNPSREYGRQYGGGQRGMYGQKPAADYKQRGVDVEFEEFFEYENAESAAPKDEITESQPDVTGFNRGADYRVVGETMNTYIIVEAGETLWLIDKHAAHERIHFDRLITGKYDPEPQLLISPVMAKVGADSAELLMENIPLLESLGFEIEPFGIDAVAVRQIPSQIDTGDAEPILSDIEKELRLGLEDGTRSRDEIYASVACRAAIKSGRDSGMYELEYIAERVMRGDVRYCPHGRPVAVEITKQYIDKSFRRIV